MRASIKARWVLDQMAMLPLVLPRIVMGIAILKMYLMLPLPVYGTLWILILAFMARYLPYGIRFSHSALLSLHKELEEGAMVSGASWFQMMRQVVVPLIMPALLAGWIYVFLITFKELSIALLLYSPGSQVVAVTIWELWDNGHVGELAAFSLVITLGTVIVGSIFFNIAQRYGLQDYQRFQLVRWAERRLQRLNLPEPVPLFQRSRLQPLKRFGGLVVKFTVIDADAHISRAGL